MKFNVLINHADEGALYDKNAFTGRPVHDYTKVYLAGPMSGIPNYNRENFARVAKWLRDKGVEVYSPGEMEDEKAGYRINLTNSIIALLTQGWAMYMLDGWFNSKGAKIEHSLALALEIPIMYENPMHAAYSTKLV